MLPVKLAMDLCTGRAIGQTFLSPDPALVPATDLDPIEGRGTKPAPFS